MKLRNLKVGYFDPLLWAVRVMICVETFCIGGKCSVVLCLKNRRYRGVSSLIEGSHVMSYVTVNVTNLALGKPAFQSSTYSEELASRAVDGDTSARYSQGSCTHTLPEPLPWWYVDLQDVYRVQEIVITNRADCCRKS